MPKKPILTIADIAQIANVSKSTVSRALNDSPLISQETKDRVCCIAKDNNFCLNAPAQQLSLKQSTTIAFVTHAYNKEFSVDDLFVLEMMGGVSRGLYTNGYDMLVIHVDPGDTGWANRYLDSRRAAGFILLTGSRKQYHIQQLVSSGAPFIVFGVPTLNPTYCSVTGDNVSGGRLATEHLIEAGRERIGFIGGPKEEMEVQLRCAGYEEALRAAGRAPDPRLMAYGNYSIHSGAKAMRTLLEQSPDVDAVFINSDLMAIAAIRELREQGRRVPEDVAVVGYDDLSLSEYTNPPLTTIRQNSPRMGEILAKNLVQYLQTGIVSNAILPVELIVRSSG